MENKLLNNHNVVFIKDPNAFPKHASHVTLIDELSRAHEVVILLTDGDKYDLPGDYIFPENVYLIENEFAIPTIIKNIEKIKTILKSHNVDLYSRHLDSEESFPILLTGAVFVSPDHRIKFVNSEKDLDVVNGEKFEIDNSNSDWNF